MTLRMCNRLLKELSSIEANIQIVEELILNNSLEIDLQDILIKTFTESVQKMQRFNSLDE